MSSQIEAISVRTTRLNHLILGNSEATSKLTKPVADGLCREGLLDALCLLYNECDKDFLKKKDKNVYEFVNRYRDVIRETNNLRVNIEDFCVKSLIGKGYFGEVHIATEKTTDDVYAIKKIKKSATLTSSQVKEERDIMAGKHSEWITSLQYAFQDHDNLYLVMEYLPGGDLLSLMIRTGAFDEDLARFYLAEMTLALNALHTMGYVHRDIKPENILLDRFGHLKLADFGNAAHLNKDGNVISMSPVGTPDYIAPELLQTLSTLKSTKSIHDVTCDFWSMGIIGYEFIAEVTPFHEDDVHETYSKILCHCEDRVVQKITYPDGVEVSDKFRNLIDGLLTKASKRLTYKQIIQHPYFDGIDWINLRQQVPPIIPSVMSEDDTSNFEDVDKKSRRSTFTKSKSIAYAAAKGNDFSGKNLPFLGYSYIHAAESSDNCSDEQHFLRQHDSLKLAEKSKQKIAELQATIEEQVADIKGLQHSLLSAQRKNAQTESLEKILLEAKHELTNMKDKLKAKTIELAACKTDVKTLKSSLKIEEENRLKNDANITEVLNSTYQKWEKAKKLSEQNYEKKIAEKKTEISTLSETLSAREHELSAKANECGHLQERVENYKELLKSSKEQNAIDRTEFDKNKRQITDAYEAKVHELKTRLKQEKEAKQKINNELMELRRDLDESICSTNSISQSKLASEKNTEQIIVRLNKQIAENKTLREDNVTTEKKAKELQKRYDEAAKDILKLVEQQEQQKQEQQTLVQQHQQLLANSRRSSGGGSEQFRSAHGSLESLSSQVEEQLRNDLLAAKENECLQRKRAERLEEAVGRLESAIAALQQPPSKTNVDTLLERKNEKLEDQLASVREQAIVERQASRTAHLSLYKLEKQVEDLTLDKSKSQRRIELAEEKTKKMAQERDEVQRQLLDVKNELKQREEKIRELQSEIKDLKNDLRKEHGMWEKAEMERMKEKSEIIEHVSSVHKLQERLEEQGRKLATIQQRNDGLVIENRRLIKEKSEQYDELCQTGDSLSELESELEALKRNYALLKEACSIMDAQLNELESMYDNEVQQNKTNCEKNDDLWTKVRQRDSDIGRLKKDLNVQESLRTAAETKCVQMQAEIELNHELFETQTGKLVEQQQELISKTSSLFEAQETIEVLQADLSNLQRINSNYERELIILKEENSKILTDLFLSKEEANNLAMDRQERKKEIAELRKEIEQLNGTLSEQKNYFLQRDIKSEATQAQYKKLISYLQQRVEDLSQKKKKTFWFSSSSNASRKENISPNVIQESVQYKKIQEDLRRERTRSAQLKEQLLQAKSDMCSVKPASVNNFAKDETPINEEYTQKSLAPQSPNRPTDSADQLSLQRRQTTKRRSYQTHRFEMTLENNAAECPFTACLVCSKQILVGHPYFRCKECHSTVHRKCRADVKTSCEGEELRRMSLERDNSDASSAVGVVAATAPTEQQLSDYCGDVILKTDQLSTAAPLEVHCVYEILDDILLLGCENGLYSYNRQTRELVHITGIDCVNFIAINPKLSKCILVGAKGESLYQCDLRHLQSRAQALACLRPKLEATMLELPFANRVSSERWHYAKIYAKNENIAESLVIACTTSRIVILRFDLQHNLFKPVCALDTATPVNSILFTPHSAIVSADKYFEIDLGSYLAEEFLNESDPSIMMTRNCHPMAAFKINRQEFLLCFEEFGIFVDEYGSRSRPENLTWVQAPNGFSYRDPLLFVAHDNVLQVLRINKSYSNAVRNKQESEDEALSGGGSERSSFINFYNSALRLIGDSDKLGVFVLTKKLGGDHELLQIDGVKALRSHVSNSLETLLSSLTSIPKALAGSSETISTINNSSD